MRKPAPLQDHVRDQPCQQVIQEAEHAHTGLITAAILFTYGDIDKPGYELIQDTARVDLDAASDELSRRDVVELSITLPSLETVLAAAERWGAAKVSRRRVCTACSSQNHDCCRREGRSHDPSWPLQ